MSFNRPPPLPRDRDAQNGRPKLWVEGSQQPRLDPKAFARVSLTLSRRAARPVLIWLAALVGNAARRMAQNQFGPWLAQKGRLGRALPPRTGIASGLVGVAGLLSAAADVAVPPPPVEVAPAFPDLLRPALPRPRRATPRLPDPEPPALQPAPQPAAAPAAVPEAEFDSETLTAIRAMIAELRDPPVVTPRFPGRPTTPPAPQPPPTGGALLQGYVPLEPPEPRPPSQGERLLAASFRAGAWAVGWGTTLLTLPVGTTRALLVHLNGENLREWS